MLDAFWLIVEKASVLFLCQCNLPSKSSLWDAFCELHTGRCDSWVLL